MIGEKYLDIDFAEIAKADTVITFEHRSCPEMAYSKAFFPKNVAISILDEIPGLINY